MKVPGDTHWFLRHRETGIIIDPSRRQFGRKRLDYSRAVATGFLTKKPSRRARAMMEALTWQSK